MWNIRNTELVLTDVETLVSWLQSTDLLHPEEDDDALDGQVLLHRSPDHGGVEGDEEKHEEECPHDRPSLDLAHRLNSSSDI